MDETPIEAQGNGAPQRGWTLRSALLISCASAAGLFGADAVASGNIILTETASYLGEAEHDGAKAGSGGLGDVNGDGFTDFLVHADSNDENGNGAGQIYLVLGKATGWALDLSLASADASFLGESESDFLGLGFYTRGGDFNGDGLDDVLLGSGDNDEAGLGAGQVYVIFGQVTGWTTDTDLSTADASFHGENAGDWAGLQSSGGDVDGDGIDDILISSLGYESSRGKVYVVLGKTTGWAVDTSLSLADASFVGEGTGDWAYRVASGSDVNGDGIDDVLVGAPGYSDIGAYRAGKVYLVPGRATGWVVDGDLGDPALAPGSFVGEATDDKAGYSVAIVDDANGDGLDDLLIGAPFNSQVDQSTGKVYLVFGRTSGWSQNTDLYQADASFLGEAAYDEAGRAVTSAGDMNGDGLGDLAIGAKGNSEFGLGAGQVFLFLGRTAGWTLETSMNMADGSFAGGVDHEQCGFSVGDGGDVDGDGYDDLLVGAVLNSQDAEQAGKTYFVRGTPCWDVDWDGVNACNDDCDDGDPDTYPGAPEICDGIDNDCDGVVPADETDGDGDGALACEDCDDEDPDVHPDAVEDCFDEIDNDCDGLVDDEDDECGADDDSADDDDSTGDDDDSTGDDDDVTGDDDTEDDDSTEPSGDDCDCRSQTAPGAPGGVAVVLLALVGLLRRTG